MTITGPRTWLISAGSVVALGFILGATVTAAWGQDVGPCAPADQLRAEIARRYGEQPYGVGITARGTILEILRTPDGATWTMLETRPSGVSCILSAGQSWVVETAPAEPLGDPS